MSHSRKQLITGLALATASAFLLADGVGAQAPQQGAAPAQFMSQSLGVVVFPSKGQSAEQQRTDESDCFAWAKNYTGFDPLAPPPAAAPPAQAAQAPSGGGGPPGGGGAVRGAAIGAAGGAIGGNAAKGAAIGAAAGAVTGVARRRGAEEAAAQQQEAAQAQQAQATQQSQQALAQKKASYNKAFGTCMQGKGYNVS